VRDAAGVRPSKVFAAATDTAAVRPTAPPIIQRLIREITARPASRAVAGLRATVAGLRATIERMTASARKR
jgi:hypothetical protein